MSDAADLALHQAVQRLPEARRAELMIAYQGQKKDRTVALVLSLFLGWLGIDRFYLGQVGLGVTKLVTFGGFGLWALVDWFLIMAAADRKNAGTVAKLSAMYGG